MRRKLMIVASGVVCLIVGSIGAARSRYSPPAEVPPGPQDLALTIYNQDFAVVKQPIALNFETAMAHIRFSDITAHVEPDSVILRDPAGHAGQDGSVHVQVT